MKQLSLTCRSSLAQAFRIVIQKFDEAARTTPSRVHVRGVALAVTSTVSATTTRQRKAAFTSIITSI
jgi:hypothetical protein